MGRLRLFHLIVLVFALVFGSITFVNHYLFRTYALDLGMFNQALYCIAHGYPTIFTLDITNREYHFLATHFSPVIYLFVPFYFLCGSYAMLVVQWLAVLAGGIGMYRLAQLRFQQHHHRLMPELILLHFYSIWGIYSALAFDFHHNVIAAMLLPWLFYFYQKNYLKTASLFAAFVLLCQENMGLWMVFVGLGLGAKAWRKSETNSLKKRWTAGLVVFSGLWFWVVVQHIMPAIQYSSGNLQWWRYSHLGNGPGQMLWHLITHPGEVVEMLFYNTSGDPAYNLVKPELHLTLLLSGGLAAMVVPRVLLMMIPLYAQKLFSCDVGFWGVNLQYCIEFVPLLSLAVLELAATLSRKKAVAVVAVFALLAACINVITTDQRLSAWHNRTNKAFYAANHYRSDLNIPGIQEALNQIPPDVPVSASTALVPHLAQRARVYCFPKIIDAEYIVLLTSGSSTYPLPADSFATLATDLQTNPAWHTFLHQNQLLILKRR